MPSSSGGCRSSRGLWSWSSRWHPGELAALWWEHGGPSPGSRVATWAVDGRTVAWGWERPAGRLDLQVDPAYGDALHEVLKWSAEGAGPRTVTVLDAETALIERLHDAGYTRDEDAPFFVHLRRGLRDLGAPPSVPAGFTLRAVRGVEDAAPRSLAAAAAGLGATHARVCARGDGAPAARATYESLGFRAYARNVRLIAG